MSGWGGWFYGFVDARTVGFEIVPEEAADIAQFLQKLGVALKEQLEIKHPYDESINQIKLGAFPFLTFKTESKTKTYRYANMMPGGRIDRSPCGTGAAAHASILHYRGDIAIGEKYLTLSITNAEFRVTLTAQQETHNVKTVLPEISGRAFIYGSSQLGIDPEDPYTSGVCLSDVWGSDVPKLDFSKS